MFISSFSKEAKKILKEAAGETELFTLQRAIKNKNFLFRVICQLIFLASLGGCIYYLYNVIIQYFAWPTVFTSQEVYLAKIDFPSVMICNLDSTVIPAYVETNDTIQDSKNFLNFIRDDNNGGWFCSFDGQPCDLAYDFEYYQDPTYGNCAIFNSGYSLNGTETERKAVYEKGNLLESTDVSSSQAGFKTDNKLFMHLINQKERENINANGFVIFVSDELVDSTRSSGIILPGGLASFLIF